MLQAQSADAKPNRGRNKQLFQYRPCGHRFKITLSGLSGYTVKYRAYVQHYGWLAWQTTANGAKLTSAGIAGTTGKGLRIEALVVETVKVS